MKSKLIISGREKPPKTYIALILSFFFPGLGHAYCGSLSRGILFALALCLAALMIPFGLAAGGIATSLHSAITFTAIYILIFSFCHIDAALTAGKSIDTAAKRYTTLSFYIAASLVSLALNSLSLLPALSLYSFQSIGNDEMLPSFQSGEMVLIAGCPSHRIRPGDAVVFTDGGFHRIARVIAKEGDRVRHGNGRFEVNSVLLSLGVDISNQAPSGPSDDHYYEVIEDRKYGITIDLKKSAGTPGFTGEITVPGGFLLVAFDNRITRESPVTVPLSDIRGRVEGTLKGKGTGRLFRLPHAPN